jgi:hypothetical protein
MSQAKQVLATNNISQAQVNHYPEIAALAADLPLRCRIPHRVRTYRVLYASYERSPRNIRGYRLFRFPPHGRGSFSD